MLGFSARLRQLMKQGGIETNKKLGELTGYQGASVGQWFSNDACPEKAAKKLAALFDVSWQYIKHGVDDEKYKPDPYQNKKTELLLDIAITVCDFESWEIDLLTSKLSVDEKFYSTIPKEAINHTLSGVLEYTHPDDKERVISAISKAIHDLGNNVHTIKYRIVNPINNRVFLRRSWAKVIFDDFGRPVRLVGLSLADKEIHTDNQIPLNF